MKIKDDGCKICGVTESLRWHGRLCAECYSTTRKEAYVPRPVVAARNKIEPTRSSQIRRLTPDEANAAAERIMARADELREYLNDIDRSRIVTKEDLQS